MEGLGRFHEKNTAAEPTPFKPFEGVGNNSGRSLLKNPLDIQTEVETRVNAEEEVPETTAAEVNPDSEQYKELAKEYGDDPEMIQAII